MNPSSTCGILSISDFSMERARSRARPRVCVCTCLQGSINVAENMSIVVMALGNGCTSKQIALVGGGGDEINGRQTEYRAV
jgi:hypothetical protein